MPRVRISDRKKLTAYPELAAARAGAVAAKPEDLKQLLYARPPQSDLYRTRYGRQLSLDRIELALTAANNGYMRDLTDLARETIALDPHLSAVVGKRINAVASVPYAIEEAVGATVDKEKAKLYADVVREQVENISHFRQNLKQLAWGLYDGRAALENQWVVRNGPVRYFLAGLGWIHPRRIQFGPDRELRISDDSLYASYSGGFEKVGLAMRDVPFKFVQFAPQLFGEYPEREGLAPRCLYWSYFKRFGARDRMILLELFGKPWRIVSVDEDSDADDPALKAAEDAADRLGGPSTTARMPRGTKLEVVKTEANAGQIHGDVIAESDRQISKLVLGQTGTTDPMPGGLNGQQSVVMQDEQALILTGDCELLSAAVEDYITDAIVALNFGPGEVANAPRFTLRPEPVRDRAKEGERIKSALDAGLTVSVEEAYEVIGFRKPSDDEARIEMSEEGGPLGMTRVARVVDPAAAKDAERLGRALNDIDPGAEPDGLEPAEGEAGAGVIPPGQPGAPIEGLLNKSDMKIIVKVNEARAASNPPLGPLMLPNGQPDPDGELTVAAYEAKQKALGEVIGQEQGKDEAGVVDPPPQPPPVPPGQEPPPPPSGEPPPVPATPDEDDELDAEEPALEVVSAALIDGAVELMRGGISLCDPRAHAVSLEKMLQPESANGSLEDLIDRGALEASRVAGRWAKAIATAVEGKKDARGIWKAVKAAVERLDLLPFSRAIERRLVHSMMVGALDSQLEAERDEAIKPSPLSARYDAGAIVALAAGDGYEGDDDDEEEEKPKKAKPSPKFSRSPYRAALKEFGQKAPISKQLFARLSSAAKQRAFTVAGLASDHALKLAKSELENSLAKGTSLADFSARLTSRFESAGFSVPNRSHLETVFRTNLLGAYNSGRKAEMSQPDVVAARPYWRILTVPDARRRETHGAVHGWVLAATDPFWRSKGGPPWGFNCRCRVYSLSKKRAESYEIHRGSEITALPDKGFDAEATYPET